LKDDLTFAMILKRIMTDIEYGATIFTWTLCITWTCC